MNSYESGGLYSLFYRFLSFFIGDPVDLYLRGGAILIAACGFAIFVSLRIVSGSWIFALLGASVFLFSGALNLWPRISYAAIVVIAGGLSCAHFVRPWLAKSGILLLTAFLVTFIRPEYIITFYAFIGITSVLAVSEIVAALRTHEPSAISRLELLPGWIAITTVLMLVALWSLPVLRDDGRAFAAFSQHFALRYVETNGLSINPWWNYSDIISQKFPNATNFAGAYRVAPQIFLGFIADNAIGGLNLLRKFLSHALRPGTSVIRGWSGLLLIFAGCVIAFRVVSVRTQKPGLRYDEGRQILTDAGAAMIFMIPVLISCILIYPREHYGIMIFYLLLVCCGCFIRWQFRSLLSATAVLLVGTGLTLATPTLPIVPQPQVQTVAALRAIPGIKVMFEADLGWCIYYQPPCRWVWPQTRNRRTFRGMVEQSNADAVMLSPGLIAIADVEDDPLYRELRSNPRQHGYEPVALPNGNVLLLKR